MRIDRLAVTNFNCFKSGAFDFNPHFNLLVGDNASGKSSVLQALRIAAGSWFLGLRGYQKAPGLKAEQVRFVTIPYRDRFTFEKQFPSSIQSTGVVMGQTAVWSRELRKEGGKTTAANARVVSQLAEDAEIRVRGGEPISLPLICSYGTERLWFEQGHRPTYSSSPRVSRFDAYLDCLNSEIQETALIDWIKDEYSIFYLNQKETVALTAVKSAMIGSVEGASDLYYDGRLKDLIVVIDGKGPQPLQNLSDGLRIMLTLVGDIAKRASTLNPHLEERVLSETSGVVMIDELDLHLHPTWQRRVISDLKRIFPAIQFIATTHSPQLVGEANPEELIILDGEAVTSPSHSFGIDSSRILEEVMGAPSRDPQVQELLNDLFTALDEQDFELTRQLISKAEIQLGVDDPELIRANALMAFLETP